MNNVAEFGRYYTPEAKAQRKAFIDVTFQHGPVPEVGINGCHVEDVIDVAIDRLRELNQPPFNCRENSLAITHLEDAAHWLMRRRLNRMAQGVEGTMEPHR